MIFGYLGRLENLIKSQNDVIISLTKSVDDMKGRLNTTTFKLPDEHKTEIQYLAKGMFIHNGIAQGGQYSRGMAKDIMDKVTKNGGDLAKYVAGLSAVHSKAYVSAVRQICTAQRQTSEREIRKTIAGVYKPLSDAVIHLYEKHSRPGAVVTNVPKSHHGIVVLLRALMTRGHETRNEALFIHHGYVPDMDDGDASESSETEDLDIDEVDAPSSRKRKRTNKGKKTAKKDSDGEKVPFFRLVDSFFKCKKEDPAWGESLGKGAWVE
ncbi:hypothetical protein FRC00_013192 [Tulasnella sp. 408]|nr:hypothetical protein FRC00_013192 [Tulasnella sp. 408]